MRCFSFLFSARLTDGQGQNFVRAVERHLEMSRETSRRLPTASDGLSESSGSYSGDILLGYQQPVHSPKGTSCQTPEPRGAATGRAAPVSRPAIPGLFPEAAGGQKKGRKKKAKARKSVQSSHSNFGVADANSEASEPLGVKAYQNNHSNDDRTEQLKGTVFVPKVRGGRQGSGQSTSTHLAIDYDVCLF